MRLKPMLLVAAMATGGLSWLVGTLLHRATVDPHPCATLNGGAATRAS